MDLAAFPLGVAPPFALQFQVTSPALDLTTVSGIVLNAVNTTLAGAVTKVWHAFLVPDIGQAVILPNVARIVYPFSAGGGDLDTKGIWKAQIVATVPGGIWQGDPYLTPAFRVVDFVGRF
jgi:hypothetical protein